MGAKFAVLDLSKKMLTKTESYCYFPDTSSCIYHSFTQGETLPDLLKAHSTDILKSLWDSSLIGVCLVNSDGGFERVNQTMCRLLEYTEVELQNLTYAEITVDEDIKADLKMARQVADGVRDTYDMNKTYITKTGTYIQTQLRVLALRHQDEEFICFISQVMPIRKLKVQEPIKGKKDLLKLKVNSLPWWSIALAVFSSIAIIAAEVIKILTA